MGKIRRLAAALLIGGAVVVACAAPLVATSSQALADGISLAFAPVADGFDRPTFVTSARDGSRRLYVLEKTGRIFVVEEDGSVRPEPILDLRGRVVVSTEQGLLGLAFHPDFASDGRFYVSYTREPDGASVVSQFTLRGDNVDAAGERDILVVPQPFPHHNGGMITFDDAGMLLIGVGDGGWDGRPQVIGQDASPLLGKLLRIDVDGGEPYAHPHGHSNWVTRLGCSRHRPVM
jgi:glucose/arabinose dehydrogenase